MEKNSWRYYGVFFGEYFRKELINKAKELVDIPKDWILHADHMTIIFNDGKGNKEEIANNLEEVLGERRQLRIKAIGVSDEAIAFEVSNYKTQNEHAHITIAVAPGSKPVKSNYITNWMPIDDFYVVGFISKVPGK